MIAHYGRQPQNGTLQQLVLKRQPSPLPLLFQCWCGAAGTDIDVNGPGTCDYACTGDAGETCGGFFAFSAYEYTDGVVVPPTSVVYLGCFVDSKSARIMTFKSSSGSMSAEVWSYRFFAFYRSSVLWRWPDDVLAFVFIFVVVLLLWCICKWQKVDPSGAL